MTVIVASGSTFAVVVPVPTAVATVQVQATPVATLDRRTAAAVTARNDTTNIASPGPQGAPGGTAVERIAGEALGGHRIVRSTGATTVGYASSGNPLHGDDTLGMTLGAAGLGAAVTAQRVGPITFAGWAWAPGAPVFLGLDGLPTQVVPTAGCIQVIGHAEDATTLYLQIEPPIYFD